MNSSVFINWPFDRPDHPLIPRYAHALHKEIEQWQGDQKRPIQTVFIGSLHGQNLPIPVLLDTSGTLNKTGVFLKNIEFSLEISRFEGFQSQIDAWKKAGINRIVYAVTTQKEIPNSMIESEIISLTRLFSHVACDITLNATRSVDQWRSLVIALARLPIKHISLYLADEISDALLDLFNWARSYVIECGFVCYEWQHFAKPGYASVHAQAYWNGQRYKGFGAGACSFDGLKYTKNYSKSEEYIDAVESNAAIYEYDEILTDQQKSTIAFINALRKPLGINKKILNEKQQEAVDDLICQGYLVDHGATIGYTDRGFLLENKIIELLTI